MEEQPEALRLADLIGGNAADELRRLHAENQNLRQALEQPAQLPPNCGTGYCSCIECLFEQPAPAQEPVARRAAWNKTIRDSVDSLLAQAGYEPDSSARYQLAMMNFDVPPAPAQPPNCGTGYCSCIECLKGKP